MKKEPIIFVAGLAIGSLVGYFLTKSKYQEYAEQEIEEMRKYYFSTEVSSDVLEETVSPEEEKQYDEIRKNYDYSKVTKTEDPVETLSPSESEDIETITEDDFLDDIRFGKQELVYYALDDYLVIEKEWYAPNDGSVVEESETIETSAMDLFDNTTEDVVYIRNSRIGMDYKISYTAQSFIHDILGENE